MGRLDKLRQLISAPNVGINVVDYNGWTPFHEACLKGHTDCVRTLLQTNRVNILALGGEEGFTALHEAVIKGHIATFQAILDYVSESVGQGGCLLIKWSDNLG
jgi:ankyrin repeat protein